MARLGDRVEAGRAERAAAEQAAQRQPRARDRCRARSALHGRSVEHDGVNRHGDGRPSNARWYQSTSRTSAAGRRSSVLTRRTASTHEQHASASGVQAHRTSVRQRPGRAPMSSWPCGQQAGSGAAPRRAPGAGGGGGCGRRPGRRARPIGERHARRDDGGVVEVAAPQGLGPWRGGHGACSRSNARRSWIRPIKPTGGVRPLSRRALMIAGRPACASGRGTRACGPGGGCSVGRCASRQAPDMIDRTSSGDGTTVEGDGTERPAATARRPAKATAPARPPATLRPAAPPCRNGRRIGRPCRARVAARAW